MDNTVLPGIVYIKYLTLKYLINRQAGGIPYNHILTTENEAEKIAKKIERQLGYVIKRNYVKR